MNPSAMTAPRSSAIRGRSVKFAPLSSRRYSRQFTPPSLFSAPNTSLGNGTTTSSTFLESCFTSTCFGTSAARAESDRATSTAAPILKNLAIGIIGSSTVDFAFVFRINGLTVNRTLCRTNLPAQDFDSESQQRRSLAAFVRISFVGMNPQRLKEILARAKTKRILVIGDLMLDEFVWGKVGRISPEAPVTVVEVTGESFYPGGAANVARNLRGFSNKEAGIGMFGTDLGGYQLPVLLGQESLYT